MANNKIILGDEVLMDLTDDTVTEDTLLEGETAHDASGNKIIGKAKSGSSTWQEIQDKPFESIDNNTIYEENGVLKANIQAITIDDALSDTSTNPVQNKVVKGAIDSKADSSTTLAGYGIADAYTIAQINAKVDAIYNSIWNRAGKLVKISGTATGTSQTITIPAEAKNKELYFVTKNSADTAVGTDYPMAITYVLPNCGDLNDNKGIFFAGGTSANRLAVGKLNNNIYSNVYWNWNTNNIVSTMTTEIYYRA